ncbi:putative bifunctional diguanylate cyclase/phosphodiesterase [Vibrio sp.]|uniref:putative bifunctional diguanylate cyclase/phosphodiesterase n=1 Tax=Vibrio sp. TaxID=678 RepID=UPI003D0FB77E
MLIDIGFIFTAGIMYFATLHLLVQSYSNPQSRQFMIVALLAAVGGSYQLCNYFYFNSTSIEQSVISLKLQTFSLAIFFPVLYTFVVELTNVRPPKLLGWVVFVSAVLIAVLNTIEPYTIRFQTPVSLVQFELLGEQKSILRGSQSLSGILMHLLVIVILVWSSAKLYRQIKTRRAKFVRTVGAFLLACVIASGYGYLIDSGTVTGIYAMGFVICLFVMSTSIMVLSASHQQAQELLTYQSILERIAKGVSSQNGQPFYQQLILQLATIFNVKYCFIGIISPDGKRIDTKAICIDQTISENFSYDLAGSPCAEVTQNSTCFYPDQVQHLFPKDALLQEMDIAGYIGTPIFERDDHLVGVLVMLDTQPLTITSYTQSILNIFAARAGAELKRDAAVAAVRKMAFEDYLTQLPNRALAYERLHELLKQTDGREVGNLYLIDLDHFKVINDALGHDFGDDALRRIATKLTQTLPEDVFIARIGGDEFLLIDAQHSNTRLSDRLLHLFRQPLAIGDHLIEVNASIGVAKIPTGAETVLDMVRHAELALYQAKKKGRNQIYCYRSELDEQARERMALQSALKKALDQQQLEIHLQPQLTANGELYGAEVLVRWQDEQFGQVSPAKFIPIAEESGLIHTIGDWVLSESLHCLLALCQQDHFNGHLSINISAWQFVLPDFVDQLSKQIMLSGVDAEKVMLELTETAVLQDVDDAAHKLEQIRKLGVRIALDDFGTGYSSLAYLRDLPIDVLKIDKCFIDELAESHKSPLTETMISMGRNMNIDVIAEGVETYQQVKALRELGCNLYQGYYFAKPMAVGDFQAWLQQQKLA